MAANIEIKRTQKLKSRGNGDGTIYNSDPSRGHLTL